VDAQIPSDTDISSEAIRLSDYSRQLAALKVKATIVVLDAGRCQSIRQIRAAGRRAVFERTRLGVNDMTAGAEVPWHASKVQDQIVFFERTADAPPPAVSEQQTAAIRARPIRELGPQDAYVLAVERDTIDGYTDFLGAYPDDPMAGRVRAILAARREAITWRRTRAIDAPPAYWSYLRALSGGATRLGCP
jgi:uncharacterized caspase-like protein